MVADWMESLMSTTLTLKNIPEDVYDRLKLAAQMHHRSLNSEAIPLCALSRCCCQPR